MRTQAENWCEGRLKEDTEISLISALIEDNDGWENYFTLCTTDNLPDVNEEPTNDSRIISTTFSTEIVANLLPEGGTTPSEPAESRLQYEMDDGSNVDINIRSDIRIEHRYSDEEPRWGTNFPSLCFEFWVPEEDIPEVSQETQDSLHEALASQSSIRLDSHPDYVGNIVLILEDQRATIESDNRWRVHIDPDLVRFEQGYLSIQTQEHGSQIWSETMPLNQFDSVNSPYNAEDEIVVEHGESLFAADLPSRQSPGNTDEQLRFHANGEIIDGLSQPIVRQVNVDISIGQDIPPENEGPPAFHPEDSLSGQPTFTVGKHIWDDRKIEFGPTKRQKGWTTDSDSEVKFQIMDSIRKDLGDAVKIVDPYLDFSEFTSFVDPIETDTDVWIITSEFSGISDLNPQLQQYSSNGRRVEVLRIMDDDGSSGKTPLHDRFILTQQYGWILGTSFDTLEAYVSVITELPRQVNETLDRTFNRWWNDPVPTKDGQDTCRKDFYST